MNLKYILGGGVVLVVIVGVFIFFSNSSDINISESSGTLGENEVSIELDISDSALPDGLERSAISASRMSENDLKDPETGSLGDILFAYDLQPDGTVFNEPIRVRMSMPVSAIPQVLLVIHSSEQGQEFIDDVVFDFDPDNDLAILDIKITHFSKLIVVADSSFKTTATGGGEYIVGDTVAYKLTVQPSGESTSYTDPHYYSRFSQEYKEGTTYTIGKTKLSTSSKSEVLIPDKKEAPEKTLKQNEVYEHKDTFVCDEEGKDRIWAGPISIQYTMTGLRRDLRSNEDGTLSTTYGNIIRLDEIVQAWAGVLAKYECKPRVGGSDSAGGSGVQLDDSDPSTSSSEADDSSSAADSITTPQVTNIPTPEVQFVIINTVDNIPYAQAQFQSTEPHDGCPFYHQHSNVTVYPFLGWYHRGGDGTLETNPNVSLVDPEPAKCGFGRDVALSPKSVFVPINHFVNACDFFQFDRIEVTIDYDIKDLAHLDELCDKLAF